MLLLACIMASRGGRVRSCAEYSAAANWTAAQVRLLYGPLLACVTASKSAFTAMVQQHGDGDTASFVRAARENPEGPQGKTYRCTPASLGPCLQAEHVCPWCVWTTANVYYVAKV